MYQHDSQHRNFQISSTLSGARTRLRVLRLRLSHPFRKPQNYAEELEPPVYEDSVPAYPQLPTEAPSLPLTLQDSEADSFTSIMDGATERMFRRSQISQAQPANVSAIFVHAGAGYHSTTNEHIHLGACDRYAAGASFKVCQENASTNIL